MNAAVLLALALVACSVPDAKPAPASQPLGRPDVAGGETVTPGPPAPAPTGQPASAPVGTPEPTPAPSGAAAQLSAPQGVGQPTTAALGGEQDAERWTGNPACPQEAPPGPVVMGPVELSGAVCGLDPAEKAAIILRPATEVDSAIVTLIVGNGDWGRPGIELAPGAYVVEATVDGAGGSGSPAAYAFTVVPGNTVWRLGGVAFDFSERGGTPVTAGVPNPSVGGVISGLRPGDAVTIAVYGVPRVEGRCYTTYDPPPGCSPSPGPQPLAEVPDLSDAWLLAGFQSPGPEWGLVSTDLQPGRYLVVASVSGGTAEPIAYGVDLPMEHLIPSRISGIDFALGYSAGD